MASSSSSAEEEEEEKERRDARCRPLALLQPSSFRGKNVVVDALLPSSREKRGANDDDDDDDVSPKKKSRRQKSAAAFVDFDDDERRLWPRFILCRRRRDARLFFLFCRCFARFLFFSFLFFSGEGSTRLCKKRLFLKKEKKKNCHLITHTHLLHIHTYYIIYIRVSIRFERKS